MLVMAATADHTADFVRFAWRYGWKRWRDLSADRFAPARDTLR
jgi:hypothetical protein